MVALVFLVGLVIGCNPLTNLECLVKNEALSSELHGITPANYKLSGSVNNIDGLAENGMQLSLKKRFDNPMIESKFSILYGKVECDILAARGSGIITSFYLQSNDLDEIDIAEIFGNNPYQFQSNFFIKGNTTTWDRGQYHSIPNPLEHFNKFAVEWTPYEVSWFVNNQLVRKLYAGNPYGIPKSPMQVKLSLWAGGDPGNSKGTISWAGGPSDYKDMPYSMIVRNMRVNDYSSGQLYVYGHEKGHWVKLTTVDGSVGGRAGMVGDGVGFDVEPEEFVAIPGQERNLANGNQSDESDREEEWEEEEREGERHESEGKGERSKKGAKDAKNAKNSNGSESLQKRSTASTSSPRILWLIFLAEVVITVVWF